VDLVGLAVLGVAQVKLAAVLVGDWVFPFCNRQNVLAGALVAGGPEVRGFVSGWVRDLRLGVLGTVLGFLGKERPIVID
jgi:hypothetical protein